MSSRRRFVRRETKEPGWASCLPAEIPDGYVEDCQRLERAAREYMLEHPHQTLMFQFPKQVMDPTVFPIGALSELAAWALDNESRAFAQWLDARTDFKCTLFMFRSVVVPLLKAVQLSKGGST